MVTLVFYLFSTVLIPFKARLYYRTLNYEINFDCASDKDMVKFSLVSRFLTYAGNLP